MNNNPKVADLLRVLHILGLKGTSLPPGTPVRKRKTKYIERYCIGGLALSAFIVWHITYDANTHNILDVKRDHVASDLIKKTSEILSSVVFLVTTGTNTWPKDPSWNNSKNTVEGIGEGSSNVTAGGGAGAYALKNNVPLAGNPTYVIGVGNTGTNTNFSAGAMIAACATINSSTGGLAASCVGDVTKNGGNGSINGGGGSAAGPLAAGTNATTSTGANSATALGGTPGTAGTNGSGVGSNGGPGGNATAGGNGTDWDATHGAGAGGGQGGQGGQGGNGTNLKTNCTGANGIGGNGGNGGNAGLYGGGAGGAGPGGLAGGNIICTQINGSNGTVGAVAQGIIVLTWTPLAGARIYFMG